MRIVVCNNAAGTAQHNALQHGREGASGDAVWGAMLDRHDAGQLAAVTDGQGERGRATQCSSVDRTWLLLIRPMIDTGAVDFSSRSLSTTRCCTVPSFGPDAYLLLALTLYPCCLAAPCRLVVRGFCDGSFIIPLITCSSPAHHRVHRDVLVLSLPRSMTPEPKAYLRAFLTDGHSMESTTRSNAN